MVLFNNIKYYWVMFRVVSIAKLSMYEFWYHTVFLKKIYSDVSKTFFCAELLRRTKKNFKDTVSRYKTTSTVRKYSPGEAKLIL